MEPLSSQVSSFLITVCIGVILGLIFDLYRIFRGFIKPKWYVTQIGDLIFWILSTIIAFIILLQGNFGEVRIYVFIGFSLGLFSYIKLFSKKVQRFILKTIEIIVKIVITLFKIIMIPINIIKQIIIIPIGVIGFLYNKTTLVIKWILNKFFKPLFGKYNRMKLNSKKRIVEFLKKLNPFNRKKKE